MRFFGNDTGDENEFTMPDNSEKFDTGPVDNDEVLRILKEERSRIDLEEQELARKEAEAEPPVPKKKEKKERFFKTWHIVCLAIAGLILALSIVVFALSRTYIKPPDKQGHGISGDGLKTDAPVPTPSTEPSDALPSEQPGEDEPEPSVEPSPYVEVPHSVNENVYNILITGFDEIESSIHTDTMMVLSYNAEKKSINIVSIPRDTACNVTWNVKKINSAYAIGGINTLSREVKKITGFECDYYILISMDAMEELVNAIGGVEFDVPQRMHYWDPTQNLLIDLMPGVQTLDGEKAVQLCRWRKNNDGYTGGLDGDLGRIQMQHDFLKALAKQCLSIKNITSKINDYADIFQRNVESNLTIGEMAWFGLQFMEVGLDNIQTFMLDGWAGMWDDLSYYFLSPSKVAKMMDEYFNPYDEPITTADLNIFVPVYTPAPDAGGEDGDGGADDGGEVIDPEAPDGGFFDTPGGENPDIGIPIDPGADAPIDPGIPVEPDVPVDPGESLDPIVPIDPGIPIDPNAQ